MALTNIVFNIAKGRVGELYNRVDVADPSTARLYVIPVDLGAAADEAVRDADDYAAIITAGATDRSTGWGGKKELGAADLDAWNTALDDTNNWLDLDLPDQTWSSVPAGNNSTHLLVGYSATATPSNAQITPLTLHAFAVTTDGSNVTAQIDAEGFYRAS
jgi:hypothetical protein